MKFKNHTVRLRFSRTTPQHVVHYRPRRRASASFVKGLHEIGASELTIAAAEGRLDDVRKIAKKWAAQS